MTQIGPKRQFWVRFGFVLGPFWVRFGSTFISRLRFLDHFGCVQKTSRDMKLDPKVTQIGPKCDPNVNFGFVWGCFWVYSHICAALSWRCHPGQGGTATSKRAAARPWFLPSEAERHQTSGKGSRSASFYGDRGTPWGILGHQAGVASTKWSLPPGLR